MKKNIFLLGFIIAAMGLLLFCTKENPIAVSNGKDTVLVSTTVLFRAGGVQAVPDSVATIRLTVMYGSISNVDTFDYHTHSGTLHAIPARTAFTLKIEGLDGGGVVIFSGTKSFSGLTENMSVEITASEVSPRAPSDLILEALSSSSVRLTWHDNSSNEQGFIVERSPGNDSHFVAIDTADAHLNIPDTLVDNAGLLPSTVYYYRLRSYNNAGPSSYLTAQSVATLSSVQIDSLPPALIVTALPDSVSVESLTVTGRAYDASGISHVIVNTDTATLNADSTFSARIKLNLGNDTITITAIDNSQRKNDSVVVLHVVYSLTASDNTPPVITFSSPRNLDTVNTLTPSLSGTVNDVGGTVASFRINSALVVPTGISWSKTETLPHDGWNDVCFEATDGHSNVKYDTLRLYADTATPDTTAPSISFGGYTPGYMFNTMTIVFNVTVTDNGSGVDTVYIEGSAATVAGSVYSLPISLLPDSNTLNVEAKDKKGNRKKDSLVVILNRAPQFTTQVSELKNTATVSVAYLDTVTATDADGSAAGISYQKKAGPTDMTVNAANGAIAWTPAAATTAACTVVVSDKYQYKDTIAWEITVQTVSIGLVANYPFNGDAVDSTGNGNTGIVNGPILTTDRFGNPNSAFSFDGSNDQITIPSSTFIKFTSSFTVSLFFQYAGEGTAGKGYFTILNKDDSAFGCYDPYHIWISSLTGAEPGKIVARFGTGVVGDHVYSKNALNDGLWHHVTLVFNDDLENYSLYIDGALDSVRNEDASWKPAISDAPLIIGVWPWYNAYFKGKIDDLRMYDRALSSVEVNSLYHFNGWNGNLPVMKIIPGGTFQMGQPIPDLGGSGLSANEQPPHVVTLTAFYMDSTEVTQADYLAVTGKNPSGFTGDLTRPVENVTWFDAALYCNARSRRDGLDTCYTYTSVSGTAYDGCTALANIAVDTSKKGYRLPTEAEREYACKGGSATNYYWNHDYPPASADDTLAMDSNAIWPNNANFQAQPTAGKKPNDYGLYDMSGNVGEWCNDWYDMNYYQTSPAADPQGPATGTQRVLRGGTWLSDANYLRSAYRVSRSPDVRYNYFGFRCVR